MMALGLEAQRHGQARERLPRPVVTRRRCPVVQLAGAPDLVQFGGDLPLVSPVQLERAARGRLPVRGDAAQVAGIAGAREQRLTGDPLGGPEGRPRRAWEDLGDVLGADRARRTRGGMSSARARMSSSATLMCERPGSQQAWLTAPSSHNGYGFRSHQARKLVRFPQNDQYLNTHAGRPALTAAAPASGRAAASCPGGS
jgi:hypothetical protein